MPKLLNYSSIQYETVVQTLKESELKDAPTEADYKRMKKIFKDFKIRKEIPKFETKVEFERFIKDTIDTHLAKYD